LVLIILSLRQNIQKSSASQSGGTLYITRTGKPMNKPFDEHVLEIDLEKEAERICRHLRSSLMNPLKRRGVVVAISGGIDSSVTLALAVRALGAGKVFALQMPEAHSSVETGGISSRLAAHFKVETLYEDITGILTAVGFYKRYDAAIAEVVDGYGEGWKSKIVIPNVTTSKGFTYFSVVAEAPGGEIVKKRLPHKAYLAVVAATNFKQRIRKMLEYYHADRLNYAVLGTPNRLEYDQGFFVKLGDGAADYKPIAHLYKSQVYNLAAHLGVPEEICNRQPTTDTYSLAQGQDEFYFSLPYRQMDLCLYAKNHNIAPEVVAATIGLTPEQVERVYEDIDTKRSTTRYLHLPALLVEPVDEIKS
jgi:NAD+ synthase